MIYEASFMDGQGTQLATLILAADGLADALVKAGACEHVDGAVQVSVAPRSGLVEQVFDAEEYAREVNIAARS